MELFNLPVSGFARTTVCIYTYVNSIQILPNSLLVQMHVPYLERLDRKMDSKGCDSTGSPQDFAPLIHFQCDSRIGVATEEPRPAR